MLSNSLIILAKSSAEEVGEATLAVDVSVAVIVAVVVLDPSLPCFRVVVTLETLFASAPFGTAVVAVARISESSVSEVASSLCEEDDEEEDDRS
jgi:hypothetical protein